MRQRDTHHTTAAGRTRRNVGVLTRTAIVLFVAGLLAGCGNLFGFNSGGGGGDNDNNNKTAHERMLESLNVNTDVGRRESPEGREHTDSENPTGAQYSSFAARTEVFVGDWGGNPAPGKAGLFEESLQEVSGSGDTNIGDLDDATAVSGKFDDDALDEIVHVGLYNDPDGDYRLAARFTDDLSADASGSLSTSEYPIADGLQDADIAAAAGNFDDDPKTEVAVAHGRTVYILDDRDQRFEVTHEHTVSDNAQGELVDLVALPMTADNGDDLFLVTAREADGNPDRVNDAHYFEVVDTAGFSRKDRGRLEINGAGGRQDINILHGIRVGEIDPVSESGSEFTDEGAASGSPADEIIITGQNVDGSSDPLDASLFVAALRPDGTGNVKQVGYNEAKTDNSVIDSPAFVPVDVDGNRTDEIFNPLEGRFEVRLTGNVLDTGGVRYDTNRTMTGTGRSAPIVVGNFTGDSENTFQEDVLLFDENEFDPVVYGVDVDPTRQPDGSVETWKPSASGLDVTTNQGPDPFYVTANMDEDSDILRFDRHELSFTNPQVLAVMAAPPFHAGTGQTAGNIDTSFGKGTGRAESNTLSVGVSAGVTIGATAEAPVFGSTLGEFKSTVTTTATYNQSFGTSTSVSKRVAWTSGSEDKVLFTAVPYDVYYYEIVKSSDSNAEGTTTRVSVPRDPITQAVPLDLYNENNGGNPDVDVLKHTVGDPASYPDDIIDIHPGEPSGYRIGPQAVGLSSADTLGTLNLEISETKGESTSQGVSVSVAFETEAVIAGVVGGAQFELSSGYEYTEEVTRSTTFSGTIPDIPLDNGSPVADEYRTGLYVFEESLETDEDGTNSFPVIAYWVEMQ